MSRKLMESPIVQELLELVGEDVRKWRGFIHWLVPVFADHLFNYYSWQSRRHVARLIVKQIELQITGRVEINHAA